MAHLDDIVEKAVGGLGYELVDAERADRGRLLRVFIDQPAGVTLEDCERVSQQLTRVFAVEGIDYDRLEVSSPGLDRVLKKPADFRRFAGHEASVSLRVPLNGRRRFVGVLAAANDDGIELDVEGTRFSFAFTDLEKARLVPKVEF